MVTLQIEHGVRDFDAWKRAFDGDPVGRERGGVRGYRILRPVDDPRYVLIELDFDETSTAEGFLERLRALWGGGVPTDVGLETPRTRIVETVETGGR